MLTVAGDEVRGEEIAGRSLLDEIACEGRASRVAAALAGVRDLLVLTTHRRYRAASTLCSTRTRPSRRRRETTRGRSAAAPSGPSLQHDPEPRLPAHHTVVRLRGFVEWVRLD